VSCPKLLCCQKNAIQGFGVKATPQENVVQKFQRKRNSIRSELSKLLCCKKRHFGRLGVKAF